MAENYDLIFGQSASSQYAWSDSDYQDGWQTVGSTPPTAEQFDALQRRSDTKAKDLNDRLSPLETKATADGRQAATEYEEGDMVTADGLPNGWLLECVVPGTTGAGALNIPSPLVIGGTIIDGTVTWKMLNLALSGVPVGYVTPFLQSTAPDGWLSCSGAEVSRTAYPDLWNFVNGSSQLISESDWQAKNTSGEKNIGWFSTGDGTTTFRLPRIVGSGELTEVKRFTTAGSGSFVAPITGIYKITLQGAGGGGAGGGSDTNAFHSSGGGGGSGANLVFYEKLTAGTSYSYTIGAGGTGGAAGSNTANTGAAGSSGGASSITINSTSYVADGGGGGENGNWSFFGGAGGQATIDGTLVAQGEPGVGGSGAPSYSSGGGVGGASGRTSTTGVFGGGGAGGYYWATGAYKAGGNGGDGYIEFSFNPVPQFWYVRAFGSATNQGTIDITALANALNAKLSISSVPLIAGYNGKQTFTSSGSFTAPVTGIYRITLQGGGGGGGGASSTTYGYRGGGGGGQGGHGVFYEKLTAGMTYNFTIGAGGAGGVANTNGADGNDSTITIGSDTYTAGGGLAGRSYQSASSGGLSGNLKKNGNIISVRTGISGGAGIGASGSANTTAGGNGGGVGGYPGSVSGGNMAASVSGAGGTGGCIVGGNIFAGGDGGDGYITFEWLDTSLL